jgi:hypothetical protein
MKEKERKKKFPALSSTADVDPRNSYASFRENFWGQLKNSSTIASGEENTDENYLATTNTTRLTREPGQTAFVRVRFFPSQKRVLLKCRVGSSDHLYPTFPSSAGGSSPRGEF